MDYLATIDSPVGSVTVASDGEAIVGLWLEGQKHFEATLEAAEDHPDLPVLVEARAWLERYFAGDDPGALPPVNPRGTAFQQRVWAVSYTHLDVYKRQGFKDSPPITRIGARFPLTRPHQGQLPIVPAPLRAILLQAH